jgi:hypothetical protein
LIQANPLCDIPETLGHDRVPVPPTARRGRSSANVARSQMKVHVVGLPSSGKTTLARGLSSRLGVPHHDLDAVAFVDQRWTWRPIADRDELVAQILASPGSVTEGSFGWVTPFFAAADRIVWLDPPLWVLIWRHVRRHGRLFQPRWLMARLRFQILCYIRPVGKGPAKNDPDLTRSDIEVALRPWADKVLRLRHPATVADVIEKLPSLPEEALWLHSRNARARSCS